MLGGQNMAGVHDSHGMFNRNPCCVVFKHGGMTWCPFIKEEAV